MCQPNFCCSNLLFCCRRARQAYPSLSLSPTCTYHQRTFNIGNGKPDTIHTGVRAKSVSCCATVATELAIRCKQTTVTAPYTPDLAR